MSLPRIAVWVAFIFTVLAAVFLIVGGPWVTCAVIALIAALIALASGAAPRL